MIDCFDGFEQPVRDAVSQIPGDAANVNLRWASEVSIAISLKRIADALDSLYWLETIASAANASVGR